jgi:hypothetical protein
MHSVHVVGWAKRMCKSFLNRLVGGSVPSCSVTDRCLWAHWSHFEI